MMLGILMNLKKVRMTRLKDGVTIKLYGVLLCCNTCNMGQIVKTGSRIIV